MAHLVTYVTYVSKVSQYVLLYRYKCDLWCVICIVYCPYTVF